MKKPAFLILFFTFCALTLSGCAKEEYVEIRNYSDYESSFLSSLDEFFTKENGRYFLYIYQEECNHCENIKKDLFDYLDFSIENQESTKIYLFDINIGDGQTNRAMFKRKPDWYSQNRDYAPLVNEMKTNKPSTLNEVYFIGTPTLYEVNENRLNDVFIGENEVKGAINTLY